LLHDALDVREFLAKESILKLDHPPYTSDFAPCDFWLFPKLNTALKGHKFSDIADILEHATTILQSIPEEGFRNVLSSGNTDSLSVLARKNATSKVTATVSVYVIKYSFYGAFRELNCHTSYIYIYTHTHTHTHTHSYLHIFLIVCEFLSGIIPICSTELLA
jgi:hypothetical protein